MLVEFDPKEHKDAKKLYEIRSNDIGGVTEFELVPSTVSFEAASKTPWYYFIEIDEPQNEVKQ